MKLYKVGFIGTGNIANAIINGIISSGYIKPDNILLFDVDVVKINSLKSLNSFCNFFIAYSP